MTSYDVIGDVHGFADKLTGLLREMGYVERNGAWRLAGRQAVFVGDVIDRGPQQRETIHIVRNMVEAGTAQITLGNHEFNAVGYATPKEGGGYLRTHDRIHDEQHEAFINAVGFGSPIHQELIKWFKTIPMWLELDGLRVIHACWSDPDVAYLRQRVSATNSLTDAFVVDAHDSDQPAYESVEILLKGPEVRLPGEISFADKSDVRRRDVRLRWWDESARNWSHLLPPGTELFDGEQPLDSLPDEPIPADLLHRYDSDIPVIFGHYWFDPPHEVENPKALCVDYSAGATHGPLVAYRFDGEPEFKADHLVGV